MDKRQLLLLQVCIKSKFLKTTLKYTMKSFKLNTHRGLLWIMRPWIQLTLRIRNVTLLSTKFMQMTLGHSCLSTCSSCLLDRRVAYMLIKLQLPVIMRSRFLWWTPSSLLNTALSITRLPMLLMGMLTLTVIHTIFNLMNTGQQSFQQANSIMSLKLWSRIDLSMVKD